LEDLRQKMRTRVLRARDDQEEDPGVLKMDENYKGEGGGRREEGKTRDEIEKGSKKGPRKKSWQLLRSRNHPKKKKEIKRSRRKWRPKIKASDC
jgi:hypothetical protein